MPRRRTFGTIEPLKSGRYRAYYQGPDGQRHSGPHTFYDEGDAAAWLRKEQKLIEFNEWQPPKQRAAEKEAESITVGEWLEQWLDMRAKGANALAPSTLIDYRKDINLRILRVSGPASRLRDIPLSKLTRRDVALWYDAVNAEHTPTASQHTYKRLKTALNAAVERDLLPSNPAGLVTAKKRIQPEKKELPDAQVLQRIVDQLDSSVPRVDGSHKLIGILTFFHGMRIGEVLALRRKDFSTDLRHVTVRGTCYRVPGKGMVRKDTPKTQAGFRTVPIFEKFHDDVSYHLDTFVGESPDSLLFTTVTGNIILDTSYRSILHRAKKRAGYDDMRITPHYGRNWLITTLAEAGMPIPAIGEILGQRDLRTITEVYMRATDTRKQLVLDEINRTWD